MFFKFNIGALPQITDVYRVVRRTVWQIVDRSTLLIFAEKGGCNISTNNTNYVLTEGNLLIIPAGHHYIRTPIKDELCTLCYAHVSLPHKIVGKSDAEKFLKEQKNEHDQFMISGIIYDDPHTYICPILTDLSNEKDEVVSIYNDMMKMKLKNSFDSYTLESLTLTKLMLLLSSKTHGLISLSSFDDISEPAKSVSVKLQKLFAYIRLHSKENITLDDLCAICNFSKQHLIRIFNSEFGMPPKAYILNYRINCAKELFYRDPHISVKEVADEMGFSDQHYFSRIFKKTTGVSPTEYKNHLINFDPSKQ